MTFGPILLVLSITSIGAAACGGPSSSDSPAAEAVPDLALLALVDDDGDGACADDPARTVHLHDFMAWNAPRTRVVLVSIGAGWCAPCKLEAEALPAFAADLAPKGLSVLASVFEDTQGAPADVDFARAWAEAFALPMPLVVDADFAFGAWIDASAMPASLLLDAETAEVLDVVTGASGGPDPLSHLAARLEPLLP